MNAYIGEEERYKIIHLSFHVRNLEKEEQTKSKISRRKEIIKIRTAIDETENRKSIEKINKNRSCSIEKISKINKHLAKPTKKKKKNTQITNIRNERGDITKDPIAFKRIVKEYMNNSMSTHLIT